MCVLVYSCHNGASSTSQGFPKQRILRNDQLALFLPSLSRLIRKPISIRFIYLSNQTGVPLLYRWDPVTSRSHVLTPGEESVFPIFGGMALPFNPSTPKAVFAKDKAGDLNYNIYVVDYSQNKIERITKDPLGQVLHIFWVTDDKWIIVGHDMKTIYVRLLEADGTIHDLYTTDLQITGASYDHLRGLVAFSVGRGQDARVAVLPISNPSDVHWAPDQGVPPYNPPAVYSEKA